MELRGGVFGRFLVFGVRVCYWFLLEYKILGCNILVELFRFRL